MVQGGHVHTSHDAVLPGMQEDRMVVRTIGEGPS